MAMPKAGVPLVTRMGFGLDSSTSRPPRWIVFDPVLKHLSCVPQLFSLMTSVRTAPQSGSADRSRCDLSARPLTPP